jgi:hypothetical protein
MISQSTIEEFAYNASRALGIEHTPFEANFGFSPESLQT